MAEERQINEIRGTILGDGTVRLQTGEFTQANHRAADELMKFLEGQLSANPQRTKTKPGRIKHQPKLTVQQG